MPKIKRLPADDWFSKCIREAADWTCEHCGKKYEENSQGLHCSHYFGRRCYATRFCPDNAHAHCFACHQSLGGNPDDFYRWKVGVSGAGMLEILRDKRDDIGLAKSVKKDLVGVAKHYKAEYERLKQERLNGATGKLEVIGYV